MGHLIFYIGSVIECYLANAINQDRIYKYLAECGYKINLQNGDCDFIPMTSYLVMLIPFVNLIDTCLKIEEYNQNVEDFFRKLNALNLLEPLTTSELNYYNQYKKASVAKEITLRHYNKRINSSLLIVKEAFGVSKFWYSYDYYNQKIVIYSSQGKLSTLPLRKQEEIIYQALRIKTDALIKSLGGLENYFQAMEDGCISETTTILEEELFDTTNKSSLTLTFKRK